MRSVLVTSSSGTKNEKEIHDSKLISAHLLTNAADPTWIQAHSVGHVPKLQLWFVAAAWALQLCWRFLDLPPLRCDCCMQMSTLQFGSVRLLTLTDRAKAHLVLVVVVKGHTLSPYFKPGNLWFKITITSQNYTCMHITRRSLNCSDNAIIEGADWSC